MRKTLHKLFFLFILAASTGVSAQQGPSSVSTSTSIIVPGGNKLQLLKSHPNGVNTVIPAINYTMSYLNITNTRINSFASTGSTFVNFALFDTIIFRRVANQWETTGGDKQHVYAEGPTLLDNLGLSLIMPVAYPVSTSNNYMMRAIRDGYINRGSDNLFNNDSTSDLTYNNIERVDLVYKLGTASLDPSKAGFLIVERGGNDDFKMAAITAIDANRNPTAFGPVISVKHNDFGSPIINATTYVLRKDPADNELRLFSKVTSQPIESVFVSYDDLGISPLQKVYGYSLMGDDVNASTTAQILAVTNQSYYPRDTKTNKGGLDMAAAPGIFHTNMILAGHFFELKAQKRNCGVTLNWMDKEFANAKEYIIEKSYDQTRFEALASFTPNANGGTFTDNNVKSAAFYRVKIVPRDGAAYYSEVVHVADVCENGTISVYPNPVKDVITISTGSKKIKQIVLQGFNGTQIAKWDMSISSQIITLDASTLRPGQYVLTTIDSDNNRQSHKLVKK